jgi:hypothetical protein
MWLSAEVATYNFLPFLNPGINLGDVTGRIVVESELVVDLMLAQYGEVLLR